MGNSSSHVERCENALQQVYNKSIGKHLMGSKKSSDGDFYGGKDIADQLFVALGGYSALEDYGNSMYSETKEKLIRGIATDIAQTLKLKNNWAESLSIKEVVEKLRRIVPDPKQKKTIKVDSDAHKELCMDLARSINKRYDADVINLSAEPQIICNNVSELMYSLFTGLHSEFLAVSGDVSRILRNLGVLQEYVDSANKKLMDMLSTQADGADAQAESIKRLYDALTDEIQRQKTILANLISSVIGPTGESLVTLLEDNDDFKGLTKDLEKVTGTPEFSDKLSFLLTGSANVALTAEIVDRALKKIGMSVKEYKEASSSKELREKVVSLIAKKKPGSEELYKMLAAADTLYKYDMSHDDILKVLEKKSGGMCSSDGKEGGFISNEYDTSFADSADIATAVDKEDNPFKGRVQSARKSISKQLEKKRQLRKQLFAVLNSQIKSSYAKIQLALSKICKKIGTEIELTSELDMFVRQLANFANSQPDKYNMHIALSGFRKDIGSSFVKHQFMENMIGISEAISELQAKTKSGAHFAEIKACVDELLKIIKDFNDTFTDALSEISVEGIGKKSGGEMMEADPEVEGGACGCTGGEEGSDSDREHAAGGDSMETMETVENVLGGVVAVMSEHELSHFKTMKKSIREIDYFYRIAGIKQNMNKVSAEFDHNVENYENVLGEEAGLIIDQIQKKYNALIKALEDDEDEVSTLYTHGLNVADHSELKKPLSSNIKAADLASNDVVKDYQEGYKFLLEYVRASKIEMLEAAQALDLYLSKFSKSMQFKPDQIKEFVQILEQIEVVAKWFTDKSGDNLVGVFEAFSSAEATDLTVAGIPNLVVLKSLNNADIKNQLDGQIYTLNDHYYRSVADGNAGKFYAARLMTRNECINLVKQVEKSIKSVRALENIIATFSRVNTSVSSEVRTFMSNGGMFKAFMNYAVASVISVGYLNTEIVGNNCKVVDSFVPANSHLKAIHAKMAVALKFSDDKFLVGPDSYLELCDPLSIRKSTEEDPCDSIFEMSIKSLISKIFTVVGSYTLFNKPAKLQENSLSLPTNPLRQILGGSQTVIKVHPDATELYVRLPLLVEWYKKVFEFKESNEPFVEPRDLDKQSNPLISIIPDMDSVWGDLCKVIFIDAKNIDNGAYPSEYANKIIESITDIYEHYKSKYPSITCREIIMEFVLEINRRYGFIMRSEINDYFAERNMHINADQAYPDDDNVEYNLVDIEMNMGRLPAPSDRFRSLTKKEVTRKYNMGDLLKVVKRFRESIDKNLELSGVKPTGDDYFRVAGDISLAGIIRETKKQIDVSSDSEKYEIIHKQLHGIEKYSNVDQQKIVLFHETVITPLTVLYFTYLLLNDFNKFCISLDPEGVFVEGQTFARANLINKTLSRFKGANNPYKSRDKNTNVILSVSSLPTLGIRDGITELPSNIMEYLLRKLMKVGCDMNGLTEIAFIGAGSKADYPCLIYDKLNEVCATLFQDAKASFHQLRKYLPLSLIERYENPSRDLNPNEISLFFIQEHLFDRLFDNKFGNGLVDANIALKNIWTHMTEKNRSFNSEITKLGIWDYTLIDPNAVLRIVSNSQVLTEFPYKYISVFKSKNTFGNPTTEAEKNAYNTLLSSGVDDRSSKEFRRDVLLYKNPSNGENANVQIGDADLYELKDNIGNDKHSKYGLLFRLNKLILKYCKTFIDPSSGKIYRPLIEKFITGHNAKDILDSKNINDSVRNVGYRSYLQYTEPKEGAVLFATIANALKGILYTKADKTFGITNMFTEDNFSNLNEYQKDIMRAYLPSFEKELDLIVKKASFMIQCLENTKINVSCNAIPAVADMVNSDVPEYTQANKLKTAMDNESRRKYLLSVFDDISSTAKSLKRCIDDVQAELNDTPMYFEVYQGSIVDYNSSNRRLPFMPISHITNLMNFGSHVNEDGTWNLSLVPMEEPRVASSQYKFTYGTRGLLHHQKLSLEFAPGVESLLNAYNSKMGGAAAFEKRAMESITKNTVLLSRWILDTMYHKEVLDACRWVSMRYLLTSTRLSTADVYRPENLSCQTGRNGSAIKKVSHSDVISMVESENPKHVLNKIMECILPDNTNNIADMERKDFRIFNILDLNIVPINVHSMQREVPFVNLFNYSYTFDNIVKFFVNPKQNSVEEKMVEYLQKPLAYRSIADYTSVIPKIMSGNMELGFSRPKYLSDQLWNKVLLSTLDKKVSITEVNSDIVLGLRGTVGSALPNKLIDNLSVFDKRTAEFISVIDEKQSNALFKEGYLRYQSKLVRFIEWFAQLQRIVRMLMRSQLEWISDPVVQGNDAISKDVTEYRGESKLFDLGDFE